MNYAKLNRIRLEAKIICQPRQFFRIIKSNLAADSFFPELERKSVLRRALENIWWCVRHLEANPFYNSYGFDVKGLRDQKQYIPNRKFNFWLDGVNLYSPAAYFFNRVCLLRDKRLFAIYFGAVLGRRYVIDTVGELGEDGALTFPPDAPWQGPTTLAAFLEDCREELFVKRYNASCGRDCFFIRPLAPGQAEINGVPTALEDFSRQALGSAFIIQKKLVQHERLTQLNPSCVNTVRIVTIVGKSGGEPRIFAHFLRLGIGAAMDNRAVGGLAVLIDQQGVLHGRGFSHTRSYGVHPITHMSFEGFQLPFWPQVQELVLRAHAAVRDVPAIGWDVAITPDGPVLLEGNDNWEIGGVQDTMGGVKDRLQEFIR